MLPNRVRFLESIASELRAQENRVRDLIGSAHWLSDGHHKEYLLQEVLSRHMPSGVLVGRGFVVHPTRDDLVSREQDILIVDTTVEAPVFQQGGLVISLPKNVLATVSVKTTISNKTIVDTINNAASLKAVVAMSSLSPPSIWYGAYFYDVDQDDRDEYAKVYAWLERGIRALDKSDVNGWPGPDTIAVGREFAILAEEDSSCEPKSFRVRGFLVDGTVVFLSHLLNHIAQRRGAGAAAFSRFAEISQAQPFAPAAHTFSLEEPSAS